MPRQRRRASSDSTVATIDQDDITYYKENTVLKPASSRATSDDWPCFLLADATVYHRDGTVANLLHVDLEGPFIIRGRVEIEKDQQRFLVHKNMRSRSQWIQIQNSSSFSIGLKEEGLSVPVLWASGEAGWYEIVPSERYTKICDKMFQGIALHFSVLDQHEEALAKLHRKKKHRSKTIYDITLPREELLFKYAVSVGDGITLPEAYQRCAEQAVFLLSHFPKETEFHKWLQNEHPKLVKKLSSHQSRKSKPLAELTPGPLDATAEDFREKSSSLEAIDGRTKGRNTLRSSATTTRSTRNSEVVDDETGHYPSDRQQQQQRRPAKVGRPKKSSPAATNQEPPSEADVIMPDAPEDTTSRPRAKKEASQGVTSQLDPTSEQAKMQPNLAESSVDVLVRLLQELREALLQEIGQGKKTRHPDDLTPKSWFTKVYLQCSIKHYGGGAEACLYHAGALAEKLGPEWHQSQLWKWADENRNTKPTFDHMSEQDMHKIVRRVKAPQRAAAARQERDASNSNPLVPERGSKRLPNSRGRVGGLRPSTGSKKRLRHEADFEGDDMDLDEDGFLRKTSKRSRYFTDEDKNDDKNDEEEALDTLSSDDDDEADVQSGPMKRLVIRAEKLPSTDPKGPNHTWTCEEADCGYVVRAAHEEEGQKLIHSHYEEHEKAAQEARDEAHEAALNRETLAVQESQRGHMPIKYVFSPNSCIQVCYQQPGGKYPYGLSLS
ncbi:hypothetical protein F4778DRAFT_132080 [Xylariomycetidae sp. FL2044]|nr:hypothetical protein F4778DRAFT_132080 [Xylariomycetidae sp. FL2044]